MNQQTILIVEDEPYIALDLAFAIEDADGVVIGPAASVTEALTLLEQTPIFGAILDVNLSDGDITPVVAVLIERGVPIILQTGMGLPTALAARFPDLSVHTKPCTAAHLIKELAQLLGR